MTRTPEGMSFGASDPQRVVVTGMGVVTPIGSTIERFWDQLVGGRSGIGPITRFDASSFPTNFAGEVRDVELQSGPEDRSLRALLDRKNLYGWVAGTHALADAGIAHREERADIGVIVGTERRCPDFLERVGHNASYSDAADHLRHAAFALPAVFASEGLRGQQLVVTAACASSAQAIGLAYQKIKWGDAEAILCGGCDSVIDPLSLGAFSRIGALSTRTAEPQKASRPFDRDRDGFVPGEGAGMLLLEGWSRAKARGARIHGEILGYASSSNAYRVTDSPPDGQGAYLAMKWALEDARIDSRDVHYINAHGTSTPQNDRSEVAAIKRCFGRHAYDVPISATKSMLGHLVSASGVIGIVVCLLSIARQVVTPTINFENPDPECDLDIVPNVSRPHGMKVAMANSFGFGGANAVVVVGGNPL